MTSRTKVIKQSDLLLKRKKKIIKRLKKTYKTTRLSTRPLVALFLTSKITEFLSTMFLQLKQPYTFSANHFSLSAVAELTKKAAKRIDFKRYIDMVESVLPPNLTLFKC
jgi:hypothetical protein